MGAEAWRKGTAINASANAEQWSDLADLILVIAREIQFRGYGSDAAVSLTASEGMVMRHLQTEPDTDFPRLIKATGLLRTNLSTVLRGLEGKGLVERRVTPEDRRVTTVHRTQRGRRNYEIVRAEWGGELARAVEGAQPDPTALAAAIALLSDIKAGMVSGRPTRAKGEEF